MQPDDVKQKLVVPICLYGDPILETTCAKVNSPDDAQRVVRALNDTMDWIIDHNGWAELKISVGLAAPQIGFPQQVAVVDLAGERLVFINPVVTVLPDSQRQSYFDACLSIPDTYAYTTRDSHIKVDFLDETWSPGTQEREGTEAKTIQHEVDHLHGILFFERVLTSVPCGLQRLETSEEKGSIRLP